MNPTLIDTHCHLYLEEFALDVVDMIERAIKAGVEKMYLPAIDSNTMNELLNLEKKFPEYCVGMTGLHPCYVKENFRQELSKVEDWLSKRKFAAIGECGLDFYWDKTYVGQQYQALEQQADWAVQYDLPIILHTRNATSEAIDVMRNFQSKGIRGIFHCFGGTLKEAEAIIELGFYLGIGGVVTYKNAGLDKLISVIDLERLVLETDAPYLTPVPHRGKRNESSYLCLVAEKIASVKGISIEEVAKVTTENASMIFEKKSQYP